jgi:phenol hydroxylase P3 protein
MSEKYPETFDKYYRPRFEHWRKEQAEGRRFYNQTLPMLCQTCQIPMGFTEPGDPTQICYRESEYEGEKYHFCSDGCKNIFDHEPQKYVQAWLPVHQIYQGNCGGEDVETILRDYYKMNLGADNMDYNESPDEIRWQDLQEARLRNAAS